MSTQTKAGRVLRSTGRLFAHSRVTSELVHRACWYIAQGSQNAHCYDMAGNGEAWLVGRLANTISARAVLDIGANHGNWSAEVRAAVPSARIYAVEMIPEFAQKLRSRFGPDVAVLECAVGDQSGETVAYKLGGGGRINPGDTRKTREPFNVRLRTGDEIVREEGIVDLALVKIDVDGYDIPALRGLRETIARDRPVIQIEYSRCYIDTRYYLRDAYDLLEPLDYRIGRLMPRRIDFMPWSRSNETFLTSNYVAVPRERVL